MNRLDTAQRRKQITRSVYGLLSTLLVLFALVLTLINSQHNESEKMDAEVDLYHLAISNLGLKILSVINETRLQFRVQDDTRNNITTTIKNGVTQPTTYIGFSKRDHTEALVHQIDKLIAEISAIQAQYADPDFDFIYTQLQQVHLRIHPGLIKLHSSGIYSTEKLDNLLTPLIAVTHQLQSLHQHAYQDLHLSLEEFRQEKQTKTISMIVALTVIGLFSVITMLRFVSSAISSLEEADEELVKYREHLEELVKKRTIELERVHVELLRQERFATLGQVTATVSHELRNPLGTIRSSVYTLKKKISSEIPSLLRIFERTERNIERCDNIIGELLDYTRTSTLALEPVEFVPFVYKTLQEYNEPDDIIIHNECTSDITVKIDKDRFERVILNLLDNAVEAIQDEFGKTDYNEESVKEITLRNYQKDGRLNFSIIDSGPGIADDILKKSL